MQLPFKITTLYVNSMKEPRPFTCVYAGPEYFGKKNFDNETRQALSIIRNALETIFPEYEPSVSTRISLNNLTDGYSVHISAGNLSFSEFCKGSEKIFRNIPIYLDDHIRKARADGRGEVYDFEKEKWTSLPNCQYIDFWKTERDYV